MYPEWHLEEARREFLDECDFVVRIPGIRYLDGTFGKRISNLIPLPLYEYVGVIENYGNFELEARQVKYNVHIGLKEVKIDDMEKLERKMEDILKERILSCEDIHMFDVLDFSKKTYKRIKNSKFKIWSKIPPFGSTVHNSFSPALAVILYCLDKGMPFLEFNQLKEKYKNFIKTNKLYSDILDRQGKAKGDCKKALDTIKEIFRVSCLLNPIYSPSEIFCSLFGTTGVENVKMIEIAGWKEKSYETEPEVMRCELPIIPKEKEDIFGNSKDENISFLIHFSKKKDPVGAYNSYIKSLLSDKETKISLERENAFRKRRILNRDNYSELALVYWKGGEHFLGPILGPFYLGGYNFCINIQGRCKNFDIISSSETSFNILYENDVLEFIGPSNLVGGAIQKIKESGKGWVHYYSGRMDWEGDGVRFLETDEYKLPNSQKRKISTPVLKSEEEPKAEKEDYEEEISLEKSTLDIDYLNEEQIIKINGKIVEEFKTKEVFFARFVRLAVARKVNESGRNGRIYKYDDSDKTEKSKNFNLYIGGIRQEDKKKKQVQDRSKKRDKELYDLRKFLEKECQIYGLIEETKKKLIVSRKGSNEVNLEIPQENIIINMEDFKKFKSNLRSVQSDKYGTLPSEITERLIKDAIEAYKNPIHKI